MICKNCKKRKVYKVVKLGKQPLSGFFYNLKKYNLKKYSLDLYKCSDCDLVQLDNKVKTEIMYGKHYGYQTSVSKLMISHFEKKIKKLKKINLLKPKDNILDIGSNDASFLKLLGKKYNLWGIDPSAVKFKKNYKDMKLVSNFFSRKNILKKNEYKEIKFKLISSFAIFYDVEDPSSFCNDIETLLDDNGIWICEFSYLPLMLKNLTFDQICHEHLTYYTFTVFEKIINNSGLKIIDCKLNEINGGSIEIIISKNNSKRKKNTKLINKIRDDEKKINIKSYKNFEKRINESKIKLKTFVDENYPIAGYGASTKGNIVLNYNKLSSNKIKYICDANTKKYGKFTPGSNIQIISKEKMRENNPKFLLVLIWSFRSEIIKQEIDYLKGGGKLVFHLPKFHIISKKNYRKFLNKSFKELSYKY
tara:strand:- start:3588 stop:4844 length:1257 start_codon:yes stop_codon:yes gene_type:complete